MILVYMGLTENGCMCNVHLSDNLSTTNFSEASPKSHAKSVLGNSLRSLVRVIELLNSLKYQNLPADCDLLMSLEDYT